MVSPLATLLSIRTRPRSSRAATECTIEASCEFVEGGSAFVSWNGDAGRVRVFLDGVELDAINPRNGAVLDLSAMPIWQLEEVSVERGPGEP